MNVYEIVKAKITPDTFMDMEINMAVSEAAQMIKNYINYKQEEDIPEPLIFVWANLAVDSLYEAQKARNPGSAIGQAISGVSTGDTSFSFQDFRNSVVKSLDASVFSYASQLNRFRRMVWNYGD